MGKLSKAQLTKAKIRIEGGESLRSVARDYKVSPSGLSQRLSPYSPTVKKAAKQLVAAEEQIYSLKKTEQLAVFSLAEELRAVSLNLAGTARVNSLTAKRFAVIAHKQAQKVSADNPMDNQEEMQAVSACITISNNATATGLNLLKINRDGEKNDKPPESDLAAVYQKFIDAMPQ